MGRRPRKKAGEERGASPAQNSNYGALLSQPMGVTNLGRNFKVGQSFNGPQIAFRIRANVFSGSWSEGVRSDGDTTAAKSIKDATTMLTPLNPITPMAEAFADNHWPLLLALVESGTGSRYSTTQAEVVRYYSCVSELMAQIAFPLQLNYLLTGFDWREVAPYVPQIPPALWGMAELFNATDVGIADIWKPLYERLANKVLPPNMAAANLEATFPYLGDPSGHLLRIPMPIAAYNAMNGWDLAPYLAGIIAMLDYLEGPLVNCHNTLASFLPWRVGHPMAMFKGYDPVYEEVDYNSSCGHYGIFGDSIDPDETAALICGTSAANGSSLTYYHRGAIPLIKSVVNTPIWDVIYDATDDEYRMITAAQSSVIVMPDDDLNLIVYDGADASSDAAQQYRKYYPTRYQRNSGSVAIMHGVGSVGYLASVIAMEEVERCTKFYTDWLMGNEALKSVLSITGGSSVRTIQKLVAETWANRRN
jgi:hypothetical protein